MTEVEGSVRSLVDAYLAAHNTHDSARVGELYAPDGTHVEVATGHSRTGGVAISDGLAGFLRAFPDASWTHEAPLIEGDRAAVTYTLRGTLQAPLGPFAPSGQSLDLPGVFVLELSAEGIERSADYWDSSTFGRQMKVEG